MYEIAVDKINDELEERFPNMDIDYDSPINTDLQVTIT